jgi:prophage maintenance system killer protein
MLRWNGYDIKASLKNKFKFVMSIAEGNRNEQSIADWIKNHSVNL